MTVRVCVCERERERREEKRRVEKRRGRERRDWSINLPIIAKTEGSPQSINEPIYPFFLLSSLLACDRDRS